MSSSEIKGWEEYFTIYPFTQDREDMRAALIAFVIQKVNGGKIGMDKFIPTYDDKPDGYISKSIEQQNNEMEAFIEKYKQVKAER